MPGLSGLIADMLSSDPHLSEAAYVRLVLAESACYAALAVFAVIACMGFWRSRSKSRLREQLERHCVPASRLQPGMHGCAEWMTAEALGPVPARLVWVGRRYVEMEIESSHAFHPGTPVRVSLRDRGALLSFTTQVADRRRNGGNRLFIRRPQWLERIQRRHAFRVPIATPATVWFATSSGGPSRTLACLLTDLSASGACLACPEPIAPQARLRVTVPISESSEAVLDARAVRTSIMPREDGLDHQVACEFVHLPETAHEALVRYCFHLERVQRSHPPSGGCRQDLVLQPESADGREEEAADGDEVERT